MLNPQACLSLLPTGAEWPCVVLDGALQDPALWVQVACRNRDAFAEGGHNAYPGLELPLPEGVAAGIALGFAPRFAQLLGVGKLLSAAGRYGLVTRAPASLTPLQRLCHRDRLFVPPGERALAAVLYLFDRPELGGTAFFTPCQDMASTEALMQRFAHMPPEAASAELGKPPSYLTDSNAFFTKTLSVPPRWNRLIVYDGHQFHGSDIGQADLLDADPERGRLTVNLFLRFVDCNPLPAHPS